VGHDKIEASALLLVLVALVTLGCRQSSSSGAARAQAGRLGADESRADAPAQGTRIAHEVVPFMSVRGRGSLHRFRVPLAHARLSFVDLHYQTPLINVLDKHKLLINGGYWAYQGSAKKIQGLLVVNGVQHAPRANNLHGGVLEIRAGRGLLLASDQPLDRAPATLAIQCNPRLVDTGRVIPKLESVRLAARTALCLRDDGTILDAYLTHDDTRTTLAELGAFLVQEGCQAALNLDGGPSTAAAFRDGAKLLTIGLGEALPYGLAFD
jgi:hypothetical protein